MSLLWWVGFRWVEALVVLGGLCLMSGSNQVTCPCLLCLAPCCINSSRCYSLSSLVGSTGKSDLGKLWGKPRGIRIHTHCTSEFLEICFGELLHKKLVKKRCVVGCCGM